MKRFEALKAYFVCILILTVFIVLPGSSEGGSNNPDIVMVSSTVPANAATGVPIGNKLTATFSEAMAPATLTTETFSLKQGTTAVPGTVTYSGVTAVFKPTGNLLSKTVYTATITTGVKDLAGYALARNHVLKFTTGAAADTIKPIVTAIRQV